MTKVCDAIFIGSTSLLKECITTWMHSGYRIKAVITEDDTLKAYLYSLNIETFSHYRECKYNCDFIFSIVNSYLLPPSFIEQAYEMAINYHAGPLPKYAGMNAWCWAILHNEKNMGGL